MTEISISIVREPTALDLPLPKYATAEAAGMDLHADIAGPVLLRPGMRAAISTGIRIALPEGYEAQIRPRSGLALRHGISMVNSPGTIDSDYRGVIKAILINLGDESFEIKRGERIAQMVVAPILRVKWIDESTLPESVRGEGGFGHTGRS